mgnify:CR=1 FL=1
MAKEEKEVIELPKPSDKMGTVVQILEEKLTREYQITLEELRKKTIKIKNGEVSL